MPMRTDLRPADSTFKCEREKKLISIKDKSYQLNLSVLMVVTRVPYEMHFLSNENESRDALEMFVFIDDELILRSEIFSPVVCNSMI